MARGGSRGRRTSYVRDNSGRFASTPGGGPPKRSTPASRRAARAKVTGGTLGARGSLRRSRAKLAGKNPADRSLRGSLSLRAQKGAVTRGANRLGKVRAASTVRMAGKGPAGVIRGGRKVAARPETFNESLKRVNPAAYEKLQKQEVKVAKAQQRKAAKLASRNGASAPTGTADARGRRSARLSGVSGRIAGRARRVYAQQGERVGAGTLPNRGLFAAPMGRRSTGSNAATSGLQPGRKARGARPSGTLAKPRNLKPGAIAARKAKAAASGARSARATTNYNRAQKAALEAQQRVNRRRSPKNLAALARADQSLKTAARAYRILVGLGGEKMAVAREPRRKP